MVIGVTCHQIVLLTHTQKSIRFSLTEIIGRTGVIVRHQGLTKGSFILYERDTNTNREDSKPKQICKVTFC